MTNHQSRISLKDIRIRCRKCDRDLGEYEGYYPLDKTQKYNEISDYGNIITFYCNKCQSDMEIIFNG